MRMGRKYVARTLPPAWLWCTVISIQTWAVSAGCCQLYTLEVSETCLLGQCEAEGSGGHNHNYYLERLSRAWMKLFVPELSFSGLSISDMVAKTTSLARNLCLKPKWMLKVCTRMSFILQWEKDTRLSLYVCMEVSSCEWTRPGEQMCCCSPLPCQCCSIAILARGWRGSEGLT